MLQRRKGAAKDAAARYGEFPNDVQRGRMRFATRVMVVAFLVIALRLLQLHVTPGFELSEEERTHIGSIPLYEPRGDILDRNGITLATDRKVPSLWADPRYVADPDSVGVLIAKHLNMPLDKVYAKLTQRDSKGDFLKFVWLKRWVTDVSDEALQEIEEASDGAVTVQYEPLRFYPQRDMAAHLIGFCNRDGEAGEGVELYFDKHLRSTPGKYTARKDGHRRMLGSLTLAYEEPEGGDDVILTIDAKIQHSLEEALDLRLTETDAKRAMGVVMDPHTGAIVAMACRPAYDPNEYDTTDPALRKNRAIVDVFEPGSAFKIVAAAAALEHDLLNPATMINCENGGFNPYGHYIKDFHKLGVEPFSHCFAESSNVAIIKVAAMLGPERLDQWIQRFGFGRVVGGDFRGESRGIYRPYAKGWSKLSMGSLPMGQEIAVTMLQLTRSFAVIANGGFLVEPHFVEKVISKEGTIAYEYTPNDHERILSPSTCATMKELCAGVVTDGTGEKAQILEYRVGGKTGTAQMAREGGGGYDANRYTTVFAGFAPVANPRLVATIVVQEPSIKLRYGGYVCGPIFQQVVRDALIRMEVPEDPVLDEDGVSLIAKLKQAGKSTDPRATIDDARFVEDADLVQQQVVQDDAAVPSGTLALAGESADASRTKQPAKGETVAQAGPIETPEGTLPDFRGMSKREVQEELLKLNIPWDTQGAGWVVWQDPPAGWPLDDVKRCQLKFGAREQAKAVDEPEKRL